MPKSKRTRDPIPENFETLDALDEFWSTHSLADYDDLQHDVEFNIALEDGETVTLDPAIARQLRQRARAEGVSLTTLVNNLLGEKLQEAA